MKKKIVACMLVATMTASLTACGGGSDKGADSATSVSGETKEVVIDGITYHKSEDLTDEEITLTYITFDDQTTVNLLAERFMEIYPNIKVEASVPESGFQETISSMIQAQEAPDVIMYTDAEWALSNQLLLDITEYYENDEESKEMASTINDAGIGCFGTKNRYAVPFKFFPGIMYVDKAVCEKLGLTVPTNSWTWSEMIQLIKDATKDGVDNLKYYGLGFFNRLDSYYGIASSQDIVGEFGFNGKTFDLTNWAVGEQEFSDLKIQGYRAPSQSSADMEKWMGNWDDWCGASNHVAVFSEAFWTYQNIWNLDTWKAENPNVKIIPLTIPAVSEEDAGAEHHTIANIDFGGVVNGTPYPREAYELMKFMSFGRDGWLTRCQIYKSGTVGADGTTPLKAKSMPAPITTNEEVWTAYKDMYCEGMDDELKGYWEEYFKTCMQPIPFGWVNIAGYWNFCNEYFNAIGIHDLVDSGKEKAAKYVDEGTRKANYYHATAMLNYFGPEGYDVLSDEEIAEYEKIQSDNK